MTKTTRLRIEGMSCGNCQRHVKEALSDVDGVLNAEVSLEQKEALIEHEDTVSAELLINAVVDEGYDAALLS